MAALASSSFISIENLDELGISVLGLNTAWAGKGGNRDRGKLLIGTSQLAASLKLVKPENDLVVLTHHPIPLIG